MNMDELKYLRLARQHLLSPTAPLTAAEDLCGLQAQFLTHALHALRIRSTSDSTAGLIKSWTLRGTMHLFPESDLPLYIRQRGTPEDVCKSAWYQWASTHHDNVPPPARERFFAQLITDAIANGTDTREALRQLCRTRGMTAAEECSVFASWGGTIAELAQLGIICFKVQQEKAYRLCPAFEPLPEDAARRELYRRYFTHFGPATLRDAAYFFHAPQKEVKAVLAELPIETVRCDRRDYFHIPMPAETAAAPECIFLAGFDQLLLGYRKEENPFLPAEHLRDLFNLAGIVAPAVLLRGRIIGKWARKNSRTSVTLLESISERDRRIILRTAESLWPLGAVFTE